MTVLDTLADRDRLADTVLVIDVFRSSNTFISLLAKGAARVVPVEAENTARSLKAAHPDWVVLGERKGVMLPTFDGDNSPTQALDVTGKTAALTTSGGTRCLAACPFDREVLIASFANASAVLAHLAGRKPETVSFWAVGQAGERSVAEDRLCAEYLEARLQRKEMVFADLLPELTACAGARRLRELGQDDDLAYCTALDTETIVPRRATCEQPWSLVA